MNILVRATDGDQAWDCYVLLWGTLLCFLCCLWILSGKDHHRNCSVSIQQEELEHLAHGRDTSSTMEHTDDGGAEAGKKAAVQFPNKAALSKSAACAEHGSQSAWICLRLHTKWFSISYYTRIIKVIVLLCHLKYLCNKTFVYFNFSLNITVHTEYEANFAFFPPLVPTFSDHYALGRLLGRGGFASVYEGVRKSNGRRVNKWQHVYCNWTDHHDEISFLWWKFSSVIIIIIILTC